MPDMSQRRHLSGLRAVELDAAYLRWNEGDALVLLQFTAEQLDKQLERTVEHTRV